MNETVRRRFWSKVQKTETCWLWTACTNGDAGYGQIRIDGKIVYAHRLAYEDAYGSVPPLLDHRRTCPKNCVRPDHLRPANRSQNAQNHVGPRSDSKSGVRGVYRHKSGKWFGQVRLDGKSHGTGLKPTIEEAAEAVLVLRLSLHTHNDIDRETMSV